MIGLCKCKFCVPLNRSFLIWRDDLAAVRTANTKGAAVQITQTTYIHMYIRTYVCMCVCLCVSMRVCECVI